MIINISEILSTPKKKETYTVPIEMDAFEMNGDRFPFAKKEEVTLIVANMGNKEINLKAHIDVVLDIPCDRCLEKVPTALVIDVDKTIDFKLSDEERINDLDETCYIDHSSLDVDLLVSSEILLHFPMKTLCRSDCRGLCLKCGQNLNLGECGCDRESLDPRMAAIQDIFKNFKEV